MRKRIISIAITTGLLLLIPLVAMQFTDEVNWDVFDFVVMSLLLFSAGLLIDFTVRRFTRRVFRIIAIIVIVIVFLLIWAELGVGIFGTPWAGS